MKTRKTIGAVLAIVGLFIAVCTKDGSSHELACRFFGIALFFLILEFLVPETKARRRLFKN